MTLAVFESKNFDFMAVGKTDKDAIKYLLAGLRKHGKQYHLTRHWYNNKHNDDNEFVKNNVSLFTIKHGKCYRDKTEL